MSKVLMRVDGSCDPNPGNMAIGIVIYKDGELIKKISEAIGYGTNNIAEYKAVIFALKKTKQLLGKSAAKNAELEIRMDSELIQRQLSNRYQIKENELKILFVDVHNLLFNFKKVNFIHIPREHNKSADRLVNESLDS